MTTELSIPQVQTISERFNTMVPKLKQGNAIAINLLNEIKPIESDEERAEAISKLAKVRDIYAKVQTIRKTITEPLDELKDYLMTFERPLDDAKKDSAYAAAKQIISDYDNMKLDEKRKIEYAAEMDKKLAIYKAELKEKVWNMLSEMLAGLKKNLIQGMATWEKALTLANVDAKGEELNNSKMRDLEKAKYDGCFHTNFNMNPILNDKDTKVYIESLKAEFTYESFNQKYQEIATEIKNSYRAKMPVIKERLLIADEEAEKKRKAEIEASQLEAQKQVEDELKAAKEAGQNAKDLQIMEASFIEQGTNQSVDAVPSKKVAELENENLWLKPLIEVITNVSAHKKVAIRKRNGDYVDHVGWWLDAFADMNVKVNGIKITEVAKTIVRKKS